MKNFKRILRFLPPLIWMGVIFYLSSREKIAVSESYWLSFAFFKTLHLIEYGILFLLWYFALYKKKYGLKLAIFLSILYGMTDEWHQTFVPTREGRIRDVFIDSLGVILTWQILLERLIGWMKKNPLLRKIVLF
ncbi:VanZ family protein [bacterium]|nr:VanZ family protein [bacterium]